MYIVYFRILLEQICPVEIDQPLLVDVSHMYNFKFPNSRIKKKVKLKVKLILTYFI